jgi:hypothetical protein
MVFEKFEQVAARLKSDMLEDKLRPHREDETPIIIYKKPGQR